MQDLISKLMETKENPDDYVGGEGLLYCGKCHTPKQKHQVFLGTPTIVPIPCQCRSQATEEEKQRVEREQFKADMARRWEDGICCPDAFSDSFAEDDRNTPKISNACMRYVEQWEKVRANNIGILFYGSVGTGKSFYASCIGKALLEKQVPVAATNFPRLLNLLQGTQEKQKLLDRLSIYKLLILDDLGVERDSTYAAEQIFNVIDARAHSKLPTIVTTNLTMEELRQPDTRQYGRIYDRVLEMCPVPFKMVGESRRIGNAERRKQIAQDILLG